MGLIPIYEAMCHNHPLSKPPNLAKVLLNSHLKGDALLRGWALESDEVTIVEPYGYG